MARRHTFPAFLLVILLSPGAYAQVPVAYRLSFPEAAHHLMHVEATFADVPAGPLQLRMSRSSPGRYALHEFAKNVFDVRITDYRRQGADGVTAKPARVGGLRSFRHRARDLSRVRRPARRDVSRDRLFTRAYQHACGDHVGARSGSPADHGSLRASGRDVMARRDTADSGKRSALLHGAQPAVPDGQPVGVRCVHPAVVHRARRSSNAGLSRRDPSHRNGRRRRRSGTRRRDDRPGSAPRVRRVPTLRGQHVHVHRRLPALGAQRWHGASQQHGPDLIVADSIRAASSCSTPSRTSSSTRGTSSASVRSRSSRSTWKRRTCRASSGSPKGSPVTTVR